jgi:hypothetical protein
MSSPWRTTHIVTGLPSVPSRRTGASSSSSAAPMSLSSSLVHVPIAVRSFLRPRPYRSAGAAAYSASVTWPPMVILMGFPV